MKALHDFKLALITLLSLLIMACSVSVPAVTPKQAAELLNNKQVVMIDVREQGERNKHRIEGTIFIPLGQLEGRMSELVQYKDSAIVMQCRSGRRSGVAAKTLIKAGFTNVVNLKGGILAWDEQGLTTVKGP
jgi:rhodanese-related sulfurtransferase|tara:strand:- start:58 stop:453 length:396 start_codon:yes stop_codon:yes gene_type:complete